jgi:hypothetical protein
MNIFKNIPITNKSKWTFNSYFCCIKNGDTIEEYDTIPSDDYNQIHNFWIKNSDDMEIKEGIEIKFYEK